MTAVRRRRVPAMVVVVSALFAACGGGDSNGGDSNADPDAGPTSSALGSATSAETEPQAESDTSTGDTTPGDTTTGDTSPVDTASTTPATTVPTAPPLLPGSEPISVLSPQGADAGATPLFEWDPIDGALDYRLVVRGPDGPIWAWEGSATSIWLGGFSVEPPPGATPLAIVDETCWSVVALEADGSVVAASALLPITPSGEPDHTCELG